MDILVEAHSGIRWLVLVGLLATLIVSFMRARSETSPDQPWLSWVAIVFDIQVTLGIILYLGDQGWSKGGFIAIYHPIAMLAALGVFHAGLARGRKTAGGAGWRTIGFMTLASIVVVLAAIPWQGVPS
jgi:hypothetical protein